jgi:hypothetical protein
MREAEADAVENSEKEALLWIPCFARRSKIDPDHEPWERERRGKRQRGGERQREREIEREGERQSRGGKGGGQGEGASKGDRSQRRGTEDRESERETNLF